MAAMPLVANGSFVAILEASPAATVLPMQAWWEKSRADWIAGNSCCEKSVTRSVRLDVSIPRANRREVLGEEDQYALVMTTFDGAVGNESLGSGLKVRLNRGRPLSSAVPAVDISLVSLRTFSAKDVKVADGTTPIYVRLSDETPDPKWLCAYLDGETWSTEGVRLATVAELAEALPDGTNTSGLWCATLHLTIFTAFVDLLLDCTIPWQQSNSQFRLNANMLAPEGLQEIFERQGWWSRPPAMALWALLGASLALTLFGKFLDTKFQRAGLWRDEYFLTELPPMKSCFPGFPCMPAWPAWGRKHPSSEAEKYSVLPRLGWSWSRNMPEPNRLPHLQSGLHMAHLRNFQKKLRPALGEQFRHRVLCQNTLLEVARRKQLCASSITSHIWGRSGWVQGSLAVQKSSQLKKLAVDFEECLPNAFVRMHESRLRRLWTVLVATHPVVELGMCDLHITCTKRAKIIVDCVVGSLAFVALFFSVDGTAVAARSPADCPFQQGTPLWYIFVSLLSVTFNFIPRSLESCLAYRSFVQESHRHRQLQMWMRRCKDVGFWLFSFCLSLLYLLIICAFLANLSEADEWKWMFSFSVVLLRKLLIVPLLASLFSGLGTELSIWTEGGVKPPKKFGLDLQLVQEEVAASDPLDRPVWDGKVQELAGRGVNIRQLLDFYAGLGHEFMEHFDADQSTTHDVVRQAIIPRSLEVRQSRCFTVVVHRANGLVGGDLVSAPDPYCEVSVKGKRGFLKPWKGGGTAHTNSTEPVWEESFLAEEVFRDEDLCFGLDPLGHASLPGKDYWSEGFSGVLQLPRGSLQVPLLFAVYLGIRPRCGRNSRRAAGSSGGLRILSFISVAERRAECQRRYHRLDRLAECGANVNSCQQGSEQLGLAGFAGDPPMQKP
ncbi:unnamed protein product [Symbiodinium microadriaticum]|nr:unnamed protein product [Symbiodinium microadriaticum]CAE7929054.1 unnamed protein product [Symbiodinium sp. KB8]